MTRRRRQQPAALSLGAALLLSLLGCTGDGDSAPAPPAPSAAYLGTDYRAPAGPVLAVPATRPEGNHLVKVLLANIGHTPRGALIRFVTRSFSNTVVADALVAAHQRGVRVQVLTDGRVSRDFEAVAHLRDALGTDRGEESYAHLSRGTARGGSGELHQKTWMFSRTGRSRHVVMAGSSNLSYYNTRQYSDMWSFVGRDDVWRAFQEVFADQAADRPLADPYVAYDLGGDRLAFYPGVTTATDPVPGFLAPIVPGGAQVRVVMYAWYDDRGRVLAQQVADLARGGADVVVVHGRAFGSQIQQILDDAGVETHRGVWADDGDDVHNKLVVARWREADGVTRRRVLTGSDNFTETSFDGDNVVVEVAASPREYQRYTRYVDAIVERAVDTDR